MPCCPDSPWSLDDVDGDEAYVFHISPSFSGDTLVRVVRTNNHARLDGYIGSDEMFGESKPVNRALSPADWQALQSALSQAGFWSLPEYDPEILGLDGETWTIEGRKGGHTHSIERWCPDEEAIVSLGDIFLQLAKA